VRVNNGRDAIICRAQKWQTFLHGTHSRLVKVLQRTGRLPKPPIVRHVNKEARARGAFDGIAGKNRLVADEGNDGRKSRYR
jgi:hypothetical protein